MTDALRRPPPKSPEELGDVLASIRRLIAREQGGQTADPAVPPQPQPGAALAVVPDAPQAAARVLTPKALSPADMLVQSHGAAPDIPVPPSVVPQPSTPQLAPQATPPQTAALSQAVDAAAARMADTARRIEAARAAQDTPFRLNPDALIPPAEHAPRDEAAGAARLRLSPTLVAPDSDHQAEAGAAAPIESVAEAPAPAEPPRRDDRPVFAHPVSVLHPADAAESDPAPQPARTLLRIVETAEASEPAAPARAPIAISEDTPPMQIIAERADAVAANAAAHPAMPAATAPQAQGWPPAEAPAAAPRNDGNGDMLRQLLREAVRAELAAEMGQRIDGELRLMVRQEIAAALNSALAEALRPRG